MDKIQKDKNETENKFMFKEVTPEIIKEMVEVYKKTGFVPIVIELTENDDVEMLDMVCLKILKINIHMIEMFNSLLKV